MTLALSYLIEFGVQAVFMMAALWMMIKIQSLDYTFLGLVICGALSSAIDVIPHFGHYLAVPTLYVCVARMTRADIFPDAVFTVVVAYALTFCMNLFLLSALIGDLRPSANEQPEETVAGVTSETDKQDAFAAVPDDSPMFMKSNATSVVALAEKPGTKPKTGSQLSEATLASISLKGLNLGAERPSAVLSDGKRTFTLDVGESRSLPTSDGMVLVKCERVAEHTAFLTLNGEPLRLTMW